MKFRHNIQILAYEDEQGRAYQVTMATPASLSSVTVAPALIMSSISENINVPELRLEHHNLRAMIMAYRLMLNKDLVYLQH